MKLHEQIEQLKQAHQQDIKKLMDGCVFPFHFFMNDWYWKFIQKDVCIRVSVSSSVFISKVKYEGDNLEKFFCGYYPDCEEITEQEFKEKLNLAISLI